MTDDLAAIKEQDSIEKYLEIANQLQQQAQNSQAIEKYLQVLTIKPNLIPALNQLASLYETEQQFDLAVSYYQQVVELQPNKSICYARLARAMMSQNNIQGAINSYQRAIALKPDCQAWIYHGLGDALIKDGKHKDAIIVYRQALEQQPLNPTTIKRKLNYALNLEPENPLRKIATSIQQEAPYTGGPVQHFEMVGRDTIITLLQNGLRPDHKILDFGCGALRLGYWIVRLMERDRSDSRFIRVVKYSLATIQSWSAEFDLKVSEYRVNPLINEQVWLKFERSPSLIA